MTKRAEENAVAGDRPIAEACPPYNAQDRGTPRKSGACTITRHAGGATQWSRRILRDVDWRGITHGYIASPYSDGLDNPAMTSSTTN